MFNKKSDNFATEENVIIKSYGDKISKELEVFYNPVMKLNRDISLIVIATYFENLKPIKFCDPMGATGIREIRFLKTIPQIFEKIVIGDISKTAIENIKKNFKENKIPLKKVELKHQNAINTINQEYFDFIEIDPFGSPVPFLDIACQKIKHKGILSVTATDTAALCGTYPKTTFRKYGIKVEKTYYYEELGLRNLIAYCQIQAAKYEKSLTPIISYSNDHYYKIFFSIQDSRDSAYQTLKKHKHIQWNTISQETKILDFETKNSLGKTYVGPLCNKEFISQLKTKLNLITDNKKPKELLDKLENEIDIVGYYNPHKFQKHNKFESKLTFEKIITKLKENGYEVSRSHNSKLAIKTNAPSEKFLEIMKEK